MAIMPATNPLLQDHFVVQFNGKAGISGVFVTLSFEITAASGLPAAKGAAAPAFHRSAVTLTRGASDYGDAFMMFCQRSRENGTIVMADDKGNEIQRWNLINASVSRYAQYGDATGGQVEEIAITYEGISLVIGGTTVAAL